MVMYDRSPSAGYHLIDEFDDGVGWLAHPDETGLRASHTLVGREDRVWLFDPLEATGICDEIDALGEVAGVVVCSNYHARDAAAFARRYDIPIYVPSWLERVPGQLDGSAELERFNGAVGGSGNHNSAH